MDKEQMIEHLRNYKTYKYQIHNLEKEIKKLNAIIFDFNIRLTNQMGINADIHSKNKTSDKVSEAVIELEKKREKNQLQVNQLMMEKQKLTEYVDEVDSFLKALYDIERVAVENFFVNHRTKFDIGENIFLKEFGVPKSEKTITNIINKAFNKLL